MPPLNERGASHGQPTRVPLTPEHGAVQPTDFRPQVQLVDAPVTLTGRRDQAPFIQPISPVDAIRLNRPGLIEGAVFTDLRFPADGQPQPLRLDYGLADMDQPLAIEFTASGGTAKGSKSARKLARSAIKGYGERYMGGEQHIIHVIQDMWRRPGRAVAQGLITGVEFVGMLASKVVRDVIEEAGFGTIVEGLILGRRLSVGTNPETGHFGVYFRKMGPIERLAVIFELGPVYDAVNLVWGVVKDVGFAVGQLFTIPRALRNGPKHGYDMETGVATNPEPPISDIMTV